jgi:hypothetical protein
VSRFTNTRRRYSKDNRHFGPFTLSKHSDEGYQPLGLMLDSGGDGDTAGQGCNVKLQAFGWTLICELPQFIKPYELRHKARSWDAATIERMGRDWWSEVFPREYGFTFGSESTLHVHYGPQTHDSVTTKSRCFFLPWRQWRFVRKSWYGLQGEHLRTDIEHPSGKVRWLQWESQRAFESYMPKAVFEFQDYDGERIQATTHIEEREWRFGEGWFKWLSLFRKPRVSRSLDIKFSAEVGPEKGSWKGGTTGHGIDMLPGELHEDAFRRYCEQEQRAKHGRFHITFIGSVPAAEAR